MSARIDARRCLASSGWLLERALWCGFAALVLWFIAPPPDAEACGGADYGNLSVLRPLDSQLSELTYSEVDWDFARAEELTFAYPLVKSDPKAYAEFERYRKEEPTQAKLSLSALDAAMAKGDLDAAEAEAKRLTTAWLDLPSLSAVPFNSVAESASALLEAKRSLEPLGKDKRAAYWAKRPSSKASDERVALKKALTKDIPNGWKSEIARLTPKQTFTSLRNQRSDWLRKYPGHALADDVRLWGVRIEFFAGDLDAAWDILLDVYKRHPQRAASEMYYLLRNGNPPSAAVLSRVTDPLLLTSLSNEDTLSAGRWDGLWKLSETAQKAKWSINLQERLLHWAASQPKAQALPAKFPRQSRAPTAFWGKARAIALAKHGQTTSARKQLERTPADAQQAALLGGLYLNARQPERALALPKLSTHSQLYLVRVALSDAQLRKQRKQAKGELRTMLDTELAARAKSWSAAQKLVRDRARKDRYTEAARLQKKDTLAYARYLAEHYTQLFAEVDSGFLRGLSVHYEDLKAPNERRAVERAMERGDERWRALEAYTKWLEKHSSAPTARQVLTEADQLYIRMTSNGGASGFWQAHAGKTKLVARLRKVGKTVRANAH
ncbi:MAG: hypothetical protein H6718_27245 [Polyangiaceae bacterium]|nr:hypothetical protein [Polyangiaceae bacterium]